MLKDTKRIGLGLGLLLLLSALVFPAAAAARPLQRVIPADVAGAHVWTGTLCNGTAVQIDYHVTERGRLVLDSVTGAASRARQHRHWFFVRFPGNHLRVLAWVTWRRSVLRLHVHAWQAACPTPPGEDPPSNPDDPTDPGTST